MSHRQNQIKSAIFDCKLHKLTEFLEVSDKLNLFGPVICKANGVHHTSHLLKRSWEPKARKFLHLLRSVFSNVTLWSVSIDLSHLREDFAGVSYSYTIHELWFIYQIINNKPLFVKYSRNGPIIYISGVITAIC